MWSLFPRPTLVGRDISGLWVLMCLSNTLGLAHTIWQNGHSFLFLLLFLVSSNWGGIEWWTSDGGFDKAVPGCISLVDSKFIGWLLMLLDDKWIRLGGDDRLGCECCNVGWWAWMFWMGPCCCCKSKLDWGWSRIIGGSMPIERT